MLVVVKMPHTENLEIKGPVTKSFMNYLMNEYGEENINTFTDGYEENESVDFRETAWYKETKAKQTPGPPFLQKSMWHDSETTGR